MQAHAFAKLEIVAISSRRRWPSSDSTNLLCRYQHRLNTAATALNTWADTHTYCFPLKFGGKNVSELTVSPSLAVREMEAWQTAPCVLFRLINPRIPLRVSVALPASKRQLCASFLKRNLGKCCLGGRISQGFKSPDTAQR